MRRAAAGPRKRLKPGDLPVAVRAPYPEFIDPCLATSGTTVPREGRGCTRSARRFTLLRHSYTNLTVFLRPPQIRRAYHNRRYGRSSIRSSESSSEALLFGRAIERRPQAFGYSPVRSRGSVQ